MMKKALWCVIILAALMIIGGEVAAQEDGVVYAVLFYSPTCPHCHTVINEHLPPMQEEFGDDLQVLFINVQNQTGAQLLLNSCEPFGIPEQACGSVPTMILADEVMIGSVDIPERMPGLVRAGIADGGIGLPAIPGLQELFDAAVAAQEGEESADTPSDSEAAEAEDTEAEAGVVYAVMFYSPDCPHCHLVINDHLPPMEEEFGEALQILFVNVDEETGAQLLLDACLPFDIDEELCGSVPTVILADEALIGSVEIPERMPEIVRAGLADGGIGLPLIPGIQDVAERAAEVAESGGVAADDGSGVCAGAAQACIAQVTWQDRYADDLFGNGLATGVLVALLGSVAVLAVGGVRESLAWLAARPGWLVTTIIALATALVAATLVLQQEEFSAVSAITLGVTAALGVSTVIIWDSAREDEEEDRGIPEWVFVVVALAGLAVAGYMSYIELGDNEAVCGALGDCNLVQQSEYTEVFGLIPVGGLGFVGYLLILGAWWVSRRDEKPLADYAHVALLALLLFGVLFSGYLTFLEPFVIGASCAWCLTSAMVMLLLLWLEAPDAWDALQNLRGDRGSPQAVEASD